MTITSLEDLILKTLNDSQETLSPCQISKKTGINHSTVRNYLRRLLDKKLVDQPFPSAYCSIVKGGLNLLLSANYVALGRHVQYHNQGLHNIRYCIFQSLDFSKTECDVIAGANVGIIYGCQRNRVSVRISGISKMRSRKANALGGKSETIPYDQVFDSITSVNRKISDTLNVRINESTIKVSGFEIHEGYVSLRLEGIHNLNLPRFRDFMNYLIKQKNEKHSVKQKRESLTKLVKYFDGSKLPMIIDWTQKQREIDYLLNGN